MKGNIWSRTLLLLIFTFSYANDIISSRGGGASSGKTGQNLPSQDLPRHPWYRVGHISHQVRRLEILLKELPEGLVAKQLQRTPKENP